MRINGFCKNCQKVVLLEVKEVVPEDTVINSEARRRKYGDSYNALPFHPSIGPVTIVTGTCLECKKSIGKLVSFSDELELTNQLLSLGFNRYYIMPPLLC